MHPAATAATTAAMLEQIANPHSSEHAAGWGAAALVDEARSQVAAAVGADADEIVFTSGATEADNLALLGLGNPVGRRRIVVGALEHKAVLGPARELARRGFELVVVPATPDGIVDPDALAGIVDEGTLLVSLMLVNNEIGTVQPMERVAGACAQVGALLHVDAAQALAWLRIDVAKLGADLLSLSAHKMGGPKGIGALFVRQDVRSRLHPLLFGGEQEDGLRPGTLPTPLCVGFGAACRVLPDASEVTLWRERTSRLEAALLALAPNALINGTACERHPGSISVTLPGIDAEALVARLQPDVAVSRGSACTSGIPEPSHVLRAIGLTRELSETTIRVSPGRFTTDLEIDGAIAALSSVLAELHASDQ